MPVIRRKNSYIRIGYGITYCSHFSRSGCICGQFLVIHSCRTRTDNIKRTRERIFAPPLIPCTISILIFRSNRSCTQITIHHFECSPFLINIGKIRCFSHPNMERPYILARCISNSHKGISFHATYRNF